MAQRPRNWDRLGDQQRKRYLSAGRKQGLTDAQIRAHYESGGSLGAWRGHRPHPGASERQWSTLKAAALAARLDEDTQDDIDRVLDNLLSKGYTPGWILDRLTEKRTSRDTYRSKLARALRKRGKNAGWQPGRRRYYKRDIRADIELYFYH